MNEAELIRAEQAGAEGDRVTIKIAEDLSLPLDATTQKLAFLARSGAGKTYAAGKLVEELVHAKQQVVIVDPVGVWWGLRLAADGKKPGIPIYVFGGQHQDVPLEPTGGRLAAELIVAHGLSVVLDVSPFTGGEQRRFVTDFATALLHEKKRQRSPLMVVWEECQDFVPQRVLGPAAQMVGAMERLIKQGRNFGIGTTLISQRPQAVNKDVLNQTECLVVLQMTGPQERKTILGWVVEHGADVAGAVDQLPGLQRGEAFVWSPSWLRTFRRVHIGRKWTFDASSTPEFGRVQEPKALAPVDLEVVRSKMAETIERAKAEDPRELRRRIAELERAVAAKAPAPAPVVQRVEVSALTDADRKLLRESTDKIEAVLTGVGTISGLVSSVQMLAANLRGALEPKPATARLSAPAAVAPARPAPRIEARRAGPGRGQSHGEAALSKAERLVLTALCQYPAGRTKTQVAILTGYAHTGGGFNNALSALRTKGFLDGGGEGLRATEEGTQALGPFDPLPSGDALRRYWLGQLGKAERAALEVLVAAYPRSLSKDQVAAEAGYEPNGGGFNNALSRLRTLELISGRGELRASEELFG